MAEPLQNDSTLKGDLQAENIKAQIIYALVHGLDCSQYRDILSRTQALQDDYELFIESIKHYSEKARPVFEHFISVSNHYVMYYLVNACDEDGNTALHHAARNGHWNLCLELVDYGAVWNKTNRNGETPLLALVDKSLQPKEVPKVVVEKLLCNDHYILDMDGDHVIRRFYDIWICDPENRHKRCDDGKVNSLRLQAMCNSATDEDRLKWWENQNPVVWIPLPPEIQPLPPPVVVEEKKSIMRRLRDACRDRSGCACGIL